MVSSITTGVFVALLAGAAIWDIRSRRIPNLLTVSGLAVALALRSFVGAGAVVDGLLGAGLALVLVLPLLALGGFGGGDAKLLIAVGAFTGPRLFLVALALTALIGAVMAIAEAVLRGSLGTLLQDTANLARNLLTAGRSGVRQTLETRHAAKLPYGVAIALGSLTGWVLR